MSLLDTPKVVPREGRLVSLLGRETPPLPPLPAGKIRYERSPAGKRRRRRQAIERSIKRAEGRIRRVEAQIEAWRAELEDLSYE